MLKNNVMPQEAKSRMEKMDKYSLLVNSLLWLNYQGKSVQFIIAFGSTAYHVLKIQGAREVMKTAHSLL